MSLKKLFNTGKFYLVQMVNIFFICNFYLISKLINVSKILLELCYQLCLIFFYDT